jgi:NAD(P)-dependent dehydrogenase (short-subunit alcohol dehydrogenase family)
MASQIWLVTGASRGLGQAIAQAVLEKGDTVIAAVRNPEHAQKALGDSQRVFAVAMDVTDSASIRGTAEAAVARFGKIDMVVNNAGYGLMGAIEELDAPELEGFSEPTFSVCNRSFVCSCRSSALNARAGSSIFLRWAV